MIELDMQTVMFANVIINVVSMVVMFILWFQNHNKYSGLAFWVLDWILVAGGTLLITLQGSLPAWESMILSNSMIVGGTIILYFGLCRFAGKKNNPILIATVLALFAVFIAIHTYFVYGHNELLARSYNAAAGLLLACSLCSWLMLQGVSPQIRRISKGTGISFIIIAVVCVVRIIGFSLTPQTSNQFLQSGRFDDLMVMLLVGAIAFLVVNLVLMVNRRLYIEAEEMENTIKRSIMELQAIFKTTSVGFGILIDRIFKEVNDACCEMMGYSREEMIGKESRMFYPTDEEYRTIGQMYQKIAQSGSITTEIRLLRKNGEKIDVIMNINAFDKNDLSKGVVFSMLDITERKQAEEALKASEQNFRNSLDNSPVGIRISDRNDDTLYANQAFLNVFGYENIEELKASPPLKHYTPAAYADFLQRMENQRLGAPRPDSVEIEIVRKDGDIRHLRLFTRELMWYGKQQFQNLYYDTTERRRAEEALKASEQKYSTLIEKSSDGILILNVHEIEFSNSRMCEMTGYSQNEILGKNFYDLVAPEHLQRLKENYRGELSDGVKTENFEMEILAKDQKKIPVETNAQIIAYKGRSATIVTIRDITERKLAEEELKASEQNFRNSIDSSSLGIRISDIDNHTLYANQALLNIFGYKNVKEMLTTPRINAMRRNRIPSGKSVIRGNYGVRQCRTKLMLILLA